MVEVEAVVFASAGQVELAISYYKAFGSPRALKGEQFGINAGYLWAANA